MALRDFFERQMAMYVTYHRDRRNRITHFFGIPAIVFSLLVALATLPIGSVGPTVLTAALPVAAAVWVLWIALDLAIGTAMGIFLVPAVLAAQWIAAEQSSSVIWTAFTIAFAGGWALQLLGHVYEGRRPALLSNLFQALIGPMFLVAEIFLALGLKQEQFDRVERLARERTARDRGHTRPAHG